MSDREKVVNCESKSLECCRSHSCLDGVQQFGFCKVELFNGTLVLRESLDLRFIGYVHGYRDALSSDRNGNIQRRQHDVGNRYP